jgi:hypothetical protein
MAAQPPSSGPHPPGRRSTRVHLSFEPGADGPGSALPDDRGARIRGIGAVPARPDARGKVPPQRGIGPGQVGQRRTVRKWHLQSAEDLDHRRLDATGHRAGREAAGWWVVGHTGEDASHHVRQQGRPRGRWGWPSPPDIDIRWNKVTLGLQPCRGWPDRERLPARCSHPGFRPTRAAHLMGPARLRCRGWEGLPGTGSPAGSRAWASTVVTVSWLATGPHPLRRDRRDSRR